MVIWSEDLDNIVPMCNDFEERLIKLLWRSRPLGATTATISSSLDPSVNDHGSIEAISSSKPLSRVGSRPTSLRTGPRVYGMEDVGLGATDEKGKSKEKDKEDSCDDVKVKKTKRTWYGKKYEVEVDLESQLGKRPTKLYAPFYNGLATALSLGLSLVMYFFLNLSDLSQSSSAMVSERCSMNGLWTVLSPVSPFSPLLPYCSACHSCVDFSALSSWRILSFRSFFLCR